MFLELLQGTSSTCSTRCKMNNIIFLWKVIKPVIPVIKYPFFKLGKISLSYESFNCNLHHNFYASSKSKSKVSIQPNSLDILIQNLKNISVNHIDGPTENRGRLKYIDEYSDSFPFFPFKLGYPCLSLHYFSCNTILTRRHNAELKRTWLYGQEI